MGWNVSVQVIRCFNWSLASFPIPWQRHPSSLAYEVSQVSLNLWWRQSCRCSKEYPVFGLMMGSARGNPGESSMLEVSLASKLGLSVSARSAKAVVDREVVQARVRVAMGSDGGACCHQVIGTVVQFSWEVFVCGTPGDDGEVGLCVGICGLGAGRWHQKTLGHPWKWVHFVRRHFC